MTRTIVRKEQALRVVVAGGGVAALETLLALRELAGERVDVELLAPEQHFWFRPLAVAEPFGLGRVFRLELSHVARTCDAEFTPGELVAVDADRRTALTGAGQEIPWDVLVVAGGARGRPALPGALTFRGPADTDVLREALDRAGSNDAARIAFAVPGGSTWPLPLYDLALLTATELSRSGPGGAEVVLVTPERRALAALGETAGAAVAALLAERGVELRTRLQPISAGEGELVVAPGESVEAGLVVSVPRLEGAPIPGIPADERGFVPTDASGRVLGLTDVYAAGDTTDFPVKHGGLATLQADAVAEAIAAEAGAPVTPRPFRPVVRALLLSGTEPTYLEVDLFRPADAVVSQDPLWDPPAKISGRFLSPFLAAFAGQ
ncbi:MAG TPA: FAD-dependent oxidoreductase [Gaiellaceae bacterium]|nr:FAD-dependent oxidoreductase [Gaiellaceae bacterium]